MNRVSTVEDLTQWIGAARGRGATRVELWQKLRGIDPQRIATAPDGGDAWDVADDFIATVHQHRRTEQGSLASYAVNATKAGDEPGRVERVFLTPSPGGTSSAMAPAAESPAPLLAMSSMLGVAHQMTQASFTALQKENEQQRRTNESLVRASTGYFETFAKGYERTFADLQGRLEASLSLAAELRAKNEALAAGHIETTRELEELRAMRIGEIAKAEQSDKQMEFAKEKINQMLPVVASYLTKQPLTADTAAGDMALTTIATSLTMQQIGGLMQHLTQEQQILVGSVLQAYRAKAQQKPGSFIAAGVNAVVAGLQGQPPPAAPEGQRAAPAPQPAPTAPTDANEPSRTPTVTYTKAFLATFTPDTVMDLYDQFLDYAEKKEGGGGGEGEGCGGREGLNNEPELRGASGQRSGASG